MLQFDMWKIGMQEAFIFQNLVSIKRECRTELSHSIHFDCFCEEREIGDPSSNSG